METTPTKISLKLPLWSKLVIAFMAVSIMSVCLIIAVFFHHAPSEIRKINDLSHAGQIAASLAQFKQPLPAGYKIDLAISSSIYNVIEVFNSNLNEKIIFFWTNMNLDPKNKLKNSYNIGISTPKFNAKFIKELGSGSLSVGGENIPYLTGILEDDKTKHHFTGLVGCFKLKDKPRVVTIYDCQFNNSNYNLDQLTSFLKSIVQFNYNFNTK